MSNIERIKELVGNKAFNEAKSVINAELQNDSENTELLKLAGLTEVNLNNWKSAEEYFEKVVSKCPEDAVSQFYYAVCCERQGKLIEAKNAYIKLLKLRDEYQTAYKSLCLILLNLKEPEEAISWAKTAMEHDSNDYSYSYIIGTAYMELKDYEQALEYMLKAYELKSDKTEIINSLGTCYLTLNRADDALKMYKKALELAPENPMAYFNIGSVYQLQQNHEEAVKYLQKAVDLEEDERFLNALAMSELKLKDYCCALEHYKQLAIMCPNKENYKYNIVTCYENMHDYKTAINMLEGMVYLNPSFILPAQKLANLYVKTNQLAKAKEVYDNILLKHKISAELLHQYAIISSSLCDTDTAERMLKKVIKMNPEIAKAHKDLAIIYLNKRLFDYAKEEFESALKLAPNDCEILFEYGNYLYSMSQNVEAERYYTEALELEPDNVLINIFMALNKLVLNQLDEAYKYIMKALQLDSENEYVQFCAGRILYARGEYEEAKRYLVRAAEHSPDVETLNTLGLTYFALEDYKQALNIFASIYKKNPDSISVMMDIAKCYEALGENDSALVYLNRVTDIFPDNEDAHEMIRKLS